MKTGSSTFTVLNVIISLLYANGFFASNKPWDATMVRGIRPRSLVHMAVSDKPLKTVESAFERVGHCDQRGLKQEESAYNWRSNSEPEKNYRHPRSAVESIIALFLSYHVHITRMTSCL